MIISSKGRYALRLCLALSQNWREYRSVNALCAKEDISQKYAETLIAALVRAGVLEGSRGKCGGYRLTRPPEEITAAEVIAATEPSLAAVSCLKSETPCPRSDTCKTLPLWRALDETVNEFLSRYSLGDLMR